MNARRLLLLLTLVLTARLAFAQYPLLPQNQQPYINGTVGEERGGRNRYHYGLDMASPNGTPVYSIEAGTYNAVNGALAVGHYAYVHVINHPPAWVDEVTPVEANQFIGEVTAQHVHLQQSTGDLTNISECSVYRLMERLKDQGFPIAYDKQTRTYYYTDAVIWKVEFVIGDEKLLNIQGGERNFDFFRKLSIFDRKRLELCTAS